MHVEVKDPDGKVSIGGCYGVRGGVGGGCTERVPLPSLLSPPLSGGAVEAVRLRGPLHLHIAHAGRAPDLPALQFHPHGSVCWRQTGNVGGSGGGHAAPRGADGCVCPQRVHLDIQVGEHTNNYPEIAAKDKLTELQLRARQLLDQVEQIQKEQNYQRVGAPKTGRDPP